MNPIAHVYVVLELFKNQKLTKGERDHLIIGSILPDINFSGLIHYHKTHHQALDFFKSVKDPLHQYLASGMILHGENPKGLDYYAHKEEGFIESNREKVNLIARRYRSSLGKVNGMTAHYLVEFSTDYIIARQHPHIIKQIREALSNPEIMEGITAFSLYYGLSEKKNYKLISIITNKHLLRFFDYFTSSKTISRSWTSFTFLNNLKEDSKHSFTGKIKAFTSFSYSNLRRTFYHNKLNDMFRELSQALNPEVDNFLKEIIKKLTPLKNELNQRIH